MLDQIMGLLDKPRQAAFGALGSKDGSGAGLLQALLGVDPNSAAGQIGGTVADVALDPLNLAGVGAFRGLAKAGRLGVNAARGAEGERALDALRGVNKVAGGEAALGRGLDDAAMMGGGDNPLLRAIGGGGGGMPAKADLQLSGVHAMPDGMGGFGAPSQGGLALPEFTGMKLDGGVGLMPDSPFPGGAAGAGPTALDMPATTVGEFLSRKKVPAVAPQDEFFTSMGQAAPRELPPAGAISGDLKLSGQVALPDSAGVATPTVQTPLGGGMPNAGELSVPGGMAPSTVGGGPASYSEWRTAGDNPPRIGASAPAGPAGRDPGLLRGDETLAPRLQGGVQAALPPDLEAMLQDIDPLTLQEIMAAAVGGATSGRAGIQPTLNR